VKVIPNFFFLSRIGNDSDTNNENSERAKYTIGEQWTTSLKSSQQVSAELKIILKPAIILINYI